MTFDVSQEIYEMSRRMFTNAKTASGTVDKPHAMKFIFHARFAIIFFVLSAAFASFGQSTPNLFTSLRPDVSVVVKKHDLGADLVEMTFLNGDYPPEVAQTQIDNMAKMLGSTARGVSFSKVDMGAATRGAMLKVSFGIDGLIDRSHGVLHVSQIAKAMVGAPAPYTIGGIMVVFDREIPGPTTIRNYFPGNRTVEVQARADDPRVGVEYRIRLLSQVADAIVIPEGDQQSKPETPNRSQKSNDLYIWIILVIASIAAGALVYSLLLQSRSTASRKRRR